MINHVKHELKFAGASIIRVGMLAFDNLLDDVLSFRIISPPYDAEMRDHLIESDKLYAYQQIWTQTLSGLYQYYLPHSPEILPEPPGLELTPYTLMLCRLVPAEFDREAFILRACKALGTRPEEIESDIEGCLPRLLIDMKPIENLPPPVRPGDTWERLALFVRLINFPPLRALGFFYRIAHSDLEDKLVGLRSSIVPDQSLGLDLRLPPPLRYSLFPFTPHLLEKHPLSSIVEYEQLTGFRDRIRKCAAEAVDSNIEIVGPSVCSHCGTQVGIDLPYYVREWVTVMRDGELANMIGFVFINEVEEEFLGDLNQAFSDPLSQLNVVSRPEGLILVEGQTEVGLLPIISLKRGLSLIERGIKVFDCEGKQNVPRHFKKFKKEFPDIPIVCLLDNDAHRECQEIERMLRGGKNKYRVFGLKPGTIEDALPLNRAVQALNRLYPGDQRDEIRESDFDTRFGFLENAKEVLWKRRQTAFDQKTRFGALVGLCLATEEIPSQLAEVLDTALLLVDASRPGRLRISNKTGPEEAA